MPHSTWQLGSVTVGRVRNSADMRRLLKDPSLSADVFIVKPNWYSPHPANFTDADALRMLLEGLDGRIVVTEAYSLERQDGSMEFTVDGEKVDWRWVMKHPGWDWIREEGRWDQLRRQDKWFLDEYGFTDLFEEQGVEYVNVTEEVWRGRSADAGKIREVVDARFDPVFREELYSYIPQKLYELRGATFISFGKVKGIRGTFPSLTMKNLFGLIPDPLRSWWHGPSDRWLGRNIVDINKVYSALFNVYGICEALRHATLDHPDGEVKVPWGSYNIVKDLGFVALGRHLISLDAVLCGLIGVDPEKVSYLKLGEKALGIYSRSHVEAAKSAAPGWFPV
ncbi:MAG: DUF362 domain-containing protein [Aigarchaeota archaeon]|nr:DUF362 domain-containing protein [Aigarchaeota archaeon]